MIKHCKICNKIIKAYGTQIYCLDCKKIAHREGNLASYHRLHNKVVKSTCQCCNKEIIYNRKRKYCDDKVCKLYAGNMRAKKSYKKNYNGLNDAIKDKRRIRDKKRWHNDVKYNVNKRIANSMRLSFLHPSSKAGRHWESLVPYNREQLITRLQLTMPEGATRNDFLAGRLHIDHIIPKSLFKYSGFGDIEFQQCWALDNLHLLWKEDNLIKGSKVV